MYRQATWIEAALNGPWGRGTQPGIPVTVAEIVTDGIACAEAGAAIIHIHAYDEATGRQKDDWQIYARIIDGIRAKHDVIVYPTIPLAGGPDASTPMDVEARFGAVRELARRKLIEWTVVDPGSVQFSSLAKLEGSEETGFLYENAEDHVRHGLTLCAQEGLHPSYAIYEPGFLRTGAALARRYDCPAPIYRLMFSDGFSFGFPPEPYAVDAYLALLRGRADGAAWMAAGLDVDVAPLFGHVIAMGGHVRVGLEDARFGEKRGNRQLVEEAVGAVEESGGKVATSADVRRALR
jgi:uncharacterized protein (DUF849 family)